MSAEKDDREDDRLHREEREDADDADEEQEPAVPSLAGKRWSRERHSRRGHFVDRVVHCLSIRPCASKVSATRSRSASASRSARTLESRPLRASADSRSFLVGCSAPRSTVSTLLTKVLRR